MGNVPTGISGNTDSVAELGIYLMIGLSRGGLVDREALEEDFAGGTIAGAGLDVFWEEPPGPARPHLQPQRDGHTPYRRVDGSFHAGDCQVGLWRTSGA